MGFDRSRSGKELQIGDIAVHGPVSAASADRLPIFVDGSVFDCSLDEQSARTSRTYRTAKANLHVPIPAADLAAPGTFRVWPRRPSSPDRLTS